MEPFSAGLVGFLILLLLLAFGLPIGAAMLLVGLLGGMLAFGLAFLVSSAAVVWGTLSDGGLLAIPLFILMGELILRGGLADRMYAVFAKWFDGVPGGLLYSNIGSCALFAATSGSSVATAATVGTVALPNMAARNYPLPAALGSLAAGGTLGILIPPSINMIIYGSITETSVGKLFLAGVIPGILLTAFFMVWIFISHLGRRGSESAVGYSRSEKLRATRDLFEPALIFFALIGSLYSGLATASEAAAIAVALTLAVIARGGRLTVQVLTDSFISAARTSGMVLFIVLSAFVLNLALSLTGIGEAVTQWILSFGLSPTELLIALLIFYIVLGMFMDTLSMMVATIPLVFPAIVAAQIDPIWFGIFIVLMCELSLITPPVGMNLFVVQGVRSDGGSIGDVIRGVIPYAVIMVLFVLLLIALPGIATWLPERA
jgi:tripartite ATP-independent transporter DctM subunit